LAIGLFLAYLIFANRLVVSCARRSGESIIRKTWAIRHSSTPRFWIDRINTSPAELFERVEIIGWALPPEDQPESVDAAYDVSIVFRNKFTWYRVQAVPEPRPDVLKVHKIHAPNAKSGFSCFFSPVRMRGGVYRMGILLRTQDGESAFSWTGKRFINDRHGFREWVFQPELTTISLPEPNGTMKAHAFDAFTSTPERVEMRGWAFANTGGESADQEVLLVLASDESIVALTTEKQVRTDLRRVFGDKMRVKGEVAGFSTSLNLSDLPFGSYRLGVLLREQQRDVAFAWLQNRLDHSPSNGLVNVAAP